MGVSLKDDTKSDGGPAGSLKAVWGLEASDKGNLRVDE